MTEPVQILVLQHHTRLRGPQFQQELPPVILPYPILKATGLPTLEQVVRSEYSLFISKPNITHLPNFRLCFRWLLYSKGPILRAQNTGGSCGC